jgi:DNA-directed RNA polymerase specialized sigma24 family protein
MAPHQVPYAHPEMSSSVAAATLVGGGSALILEDQLTTRALAHVKKGDTSALHFLYVRYADELRAYIESIVHERAAADNIVQDVFADLMTAIVESEEREFPFAASMLRMATNMALEVLRRRKPPQRLGRALGELPHDQRDVLVLRNAAGLSPSQTAELLGKDEHSVNHLYERARSRLTVALFGAGHIAAEA